jgi:hypothetical protein
LAEPTLGEVAWVPLLVKEPGQRQGRISDANVVTVDILPTIADVLDVDIPWEIDGVFALGEGRDDDAKPFHGTDVNAFGVDSLDPIQLDPGAGWRSVTNAAVDRFLSHGTGVERFWRLGPQADLVGTDVGGAGLTPVDAILRDAARYDLSDEPASVPALVRLGVADDLLGEQLAVAVNGVVGAVAPAVPTEGGHRGRGHGRRRPLPHRSQRGDRPPRRRIAGGRAGPGRSDVRRRPVGELLDVAVERPALD